MTSVEKFVLAKFAAANLQSTALPGSQLAKTLNWGAKQFKAVKKAPVLPTGTGSSGLKTKAMPKLI